MALSSALIAIIGSNLPAFIAAVLVSPFLLTWLNCRFGDRKGKPPLVPHFIPYVGHGLSMPVVSPQYIAKLRKRYPNDNILSVLIFGKESHLVFDPKLCSAAFRQSNSLTLDQITHLLREAVGASKEDLSVLYMYMPESSGMSTIKDDGRRPIAEVRRSATGHLMGDNLTELRAVFTKTLNENLEKVFPKDSASSFDWASLDLSEFLKGQGTMAATATLFGPNLPNLWPELSADTFSLEERVPYLITKVPKSVQPDLYKTRDRALSALMKWQKDATEHRSLEEMAEENPLWNEYWGARFTRHRHEIFKRNGVSEKGRATEDLLFIWGLNTNAIPVISWLIIQCLLEPSLGQRVRTIINAYRNEDGTHDVIGLAANGFLKSLYLETLRFHVGSLWFRIAAEDTTVGPYAITKGDTVCIPNREMQMDETAWASSDAKTAGPFEFYPERFLEPEKRGGSDEKTDDANTPRSKDSGYKHITDPMALPASTTSEEIRSSIQHMLPFGGGMNYCPGRYFAVQEAVIVMIEMLLSFDMKVDEQALERTGKPEVTAASVGGMWPDREFKVKIRRRKDVGGS